MTLKDPRELLQEASRKTAASAEPEEQLPATTMINLDVVGARGKRYLHTFRYTVPNLGDQIKIGQIKASYLPHGHVADPNAGALVEYLAYLTVTIDQSMLPDWWQPLNLRDATPFAVLYKEALSYERRFHGINQVQQDRGLGEVDQVEDGQHGGGGPEAGDDHVGDGAPASPQRRKTLVSSSG